MPPCIPGNTVLEIVLLIIKQLYTVEQIIKVSQSVLNICGRNSRIFYTPGDVGHFDLNCGF